jgi:uncharacterized protein (UPF0262 family)
VAENSGPADDPVTVPQRERERLIKVHLEEQAHLRLSPAVEHERKVALFDLIQQNYFAPTGGYQGPYVLHLANDGQRLTFTVCNELDLQLTRFVLPLATLREVIKDYFMICESYFNAINTLTPSRIEAIDMGRRGLHNDGADLLRERLADKVDMDKATARRLFTLICVLQIRR